MTMPHLMNCSHSDTGWCLDCVKELHDKYEALSKGEDEEDMDYSLRDRVVGMFIGGAVGDALGAPVETWTPDKIQEVHGGPITGYVPAIGHKWFKEDEFPVGSTTDDTQLMMATAWGIIDGHCDPPVPNQYMDSIANKHCAAMQNTTAGWGGSTKDAIRRLQNGAHWTSSGKTDNPARGTGNGVPMKIAPLAVLGAKNQGKCLVDHQSNLRFFVDYSAMTHYSKMSAYAAMIHAETCRACLEEKMDCEIATLDLSEQLVDEWIKFFDMENLVEHLNDTEDNLKDAFVLLRDKWMEDAIPVEERRELFGGGSCYLYHSLPFTYSFFLHADDDPLQLMLDLVNAGGDTDTNAAMLGNLIGALYGFEFFELPENAWTLAGLQGASEIITVANLLCDTIGIK